MTLKGATSPTLVLDAGTGLTKVSTTLYGKAFQGEIILSHLHWDHVHGLPFFTAGDTADADVVLHLPAQDGARSADPVSAARLLGRAMSPPHFPIGPGGLAGRWRFRAADTGRFDAGGARVRLTEIPHKGGRTFGIRVEADGESFAYLPDHAPSVDSGPGTDLARGVDVLLHDAQFAESERDVAAAYGHATVGDAVAAAERARAGRLVLIHHAPGRTDDQIYALAEREAANARIPVAVGREGDVLVL
ncbi:MBL fold metallo-hydrolase [Phytoactinopolyspora mesophila]|uniref:MBL fold metallo-hydrolase n=1 Tax=Phytoactinopolyspora mesophila TaxID=2650750 RepID=UPI0013917288